MSKHTTGPWHVNRKHPTKVNGPEGAPGVIVDCGENVQHTEAIANARLIAACPDLLAACQETLATLDADWVGEAMDGENTVRRKLRAAIRKAEGQ